MTAVSQNSVSQVLSTCVRVTERLFKVHIPGRRLTESESPAVNLCSEALFRLLSPICICDLPPPLQRPGPRPAARALPHSGLASPQRVFVITLTSPPPPTVWKSDCLPFMLVVPEQEKSYKHCPLTPLADGLTAFPSAVETTSLLQKLHSTSRC